MNSLNNIKSKQLVRSHALCGDDDTKLNVGRNAEKFALSKSSGGSSAASKDSTSDAYVDSTGVNLEEFITLTLHKNQRDRDTLLKLEEELREFVLDTNINLKKFSPMSSYNRMLVHRVAAFFGLDHNVDQTGTCVCVTKSSPYRIRFLIFSLLKTDMPFIFFMYFDVELTFFRPEKKFIEYIDENIPFTDPLPRNVVGEEILSDPGSTDLRKVRSLDDRDTVKRRGRGKISNQDSSSSAEGILESPARPWSSTESSSESNFSQMSMLKRQAHLASKACSFGGSPPVYYNSPRAETPGSKIHFCPYVESVQQAPSHMPVADFQQSPPLLAPNQPVIFAVSSLAQVPPGAIIIHPMTELSSFARSREMCAVLSGLPYYNADGSIYRHDVMTPTPPAFYETAGAYGSPYAAASNAMSSCVSSSDVNYLTSQFQQMGVDAASYHATQATAPVYVNQQWNCGPSARYYVVPQRTSTVEQDLNQAVYVQSNNTQQQLQYVPSPPTINRQEESRQSIDEGEHQSPSENVENSINKIKEISPSPTDQS
uniref:R3H domain-containing protein n=1 Tax=Romanomermis culicivorax TaxID=13658 RepID=A0A915ITD8_ROMCU